MIADNEIVLQDVYYHFASLKTDIAKHKIENNRNNLIVFAMDDFISKIELIEQIIKSYDNNNLKALSNKINSILLIDKELHIVNVIIQKKKYLHQLDKSKSALITHTI